MKRFILTGSITSAFWSIITENDNITVRLLRSFHFGCGAYQKVKLGQAISLAQFYTMLRFLLLQKHTVQEKLIMIARLIDMLEHDFHEVYDDSTPPFAGGCEVAVREWSVKCVQC